MYIRFLAFRRFLEGGNPSISVGRIPTPLLVPSWDLPVCHLPNWGMSCSQLSQKTGWPGPKASTA